ncbi:hypothetical protein BGZ81_008896 [Podila clonocystis]|nr:hypothetical protein BGZ81_008896 [Podila clonocystis]
MPPSAFDLPEICNLIAAHLPRDALLACCRVSKEWHSSFFQHLWRSVVFGGAGPIFSDSDTDPRVGNIRRLKYDYCTFEGPMPTCGYTHLQELVIHQDQRHRRARNDPWPLLAALMRRLANNSPLSTLEMVRDNSATAEFWEAVSLCRQLTTLRFNGYSFPWDDAGTRGAPFYFWKVCRSVETLDVYNCEAIDCLLIHARMFRLKHLCMTHFYAHTRREGWESAVPWLCSPNLETLVYNDSTTSRHNDEVHAMVVDIKAAIAAATEGRDHYALASESNNQGADDMDAKEKEDMKHYRGLIPGKKIHSLEIDLHDIRDEDLGFIVNNMDTLSRLCTRFHLIGPTTIEALGRHHHTIVELDFQCGSTNTCQVLNTVMSITQLQVLALRNIDHAAFVQSDENTWACLGMKRLGLSFRDRSWTDDHLHAEIASGSRAIWQHVSRLTKIEDLSVYAMYDHIRNPGFQRPLPLTCGLEQLSSLTGLRYIHVDLVMLAVSDAKWMAEAWPKLELVRGQQQPEDRFDIYQVVQTFKDKGISVEVPNGHSSEYASL